MAIVVNGVERLQEDETTVVVKNVEYTLSEVAVSGSYNDLADKPEGSESGPVTIADVDGLEQALADKQSAGDYALTSELEGLVTDDEMADALVEKQDAGDYATNAALNTGLAGKQPVGNYLTAADLSGPVLSVVVASSDSSARVKAMADFVCDGTADEVEINQAIASVSNDSVSYGGQGGLVQLVGKKFTVAGPILMRSQTRVLGQGQWSTFIFAAPTFKAGEKSGVFQLYSPNTQYTTVQAIAIHGNSYGGARTSGFYYSQGVGVEWDASHRLLDIYIYATGWHGLYLTSSVSGSRARAFLVQNVRIIDAGGTSTPTACGVYLDAADCFFLGVDTGSSASHGFRVNGGNNRFTACKAWFAGSLATAQHQGSGFYIEAQRNQFSACEAQDNYGDGFYLSSAGLHTLSGCTADSNGYNRDGGAGQGVGWTGSGFFLAGYAVIDGMAFDKNESRRGLYQKYGVEIGATWVKAIVNVSATTNALAPVGGTNAAAGSIINWI